MMGASSPCQITQVHAQQVEPAAPAGNQGTETSGPEPPAVSSATPLANAPETSKKSIPAGEGIPAMVADGTQMLGALGKQVRSSTGEEMGRIVDVIIDRSARVRAAVFDFGGFLGLGNRQIAVAWSAIRLPAQDKPGALVVDFTRDQLRVAPTYKAGEQVVLLGQSDPPPAAATNGTPGREGAGQEAKEPPSK